MFMVGFDLGKRKSQICVEEKEGKVLAEIRLNTTPEAIKAALAPFPHAEVLIEASTSADWVARVIESIGCTVVVADPRFSPMYAQSNKKVKNDRRDARALADALRLKAFRPAHRKSDEARKLHAQLLIRRQLLHVRTRLINMARALCEREGLMIPSCDGDRFADALAHVMVDDWLYEVILPLHNQIEALTSQIATVDSKLEAIAKANPVARNLRTVRGVGALTSLAFIAVIDDPKRFESARQVTSYLGLVPGENNSGDSKRRPHAITKTGDPMLRAYLTEAAFVATNKFAPDSNLKRWHHKLTGGNSKKNPAKKKAAVAVARRLARILWAMWRDNKPFDDSRTAPVTAPSTQKEAA